MLFSSLFKKAKSASGSQKCFQGTVILANFASDEERILLHVSKGRTYSNKAPISIIEGTVLQPNKCNRKEYLGVCIFSDLKIFIFTGKAHVVFSLLSKLLRATFIFNNLSTRLGGVGS